MADFPVMGAIFSLLSIPIALLYKKIMKINYFYKFSLLVECIMILWIIMFLIDPWSSDNSLRNSYQIALFIYIARQITFLFGDFLGRAETIFLKKTDILSSIDISKQIGSISGMIISFIFYKILEDSYLIIDNPSQVYYIHFLLLFIQVIIIYLLMKSFKRIV
tara:strand:+ start:2084 stop:2572 length:489 start_codon:yes stop_codon:yes gene_type:complete